MKEDKLWEKIENGILNLDSEGHNPIDEETLKAICSIIKSTKEDLHISLKLRGIDDTAAVLLAFAILNSKAKISINLEQNEIGHIGVVALTEAIRNKIYFIKLNLDKNNIGSKGIKFVIEILSELKRGATINLNLSAMSEEDFKGLESAVKKSPVPLRVTTHRRVIECDRFVELKKYMPEIGISDPRLPNIFAYEDKIGNSKDKVEVDLSFNSFSPSVKAESMHWMARVLAEKAKLPLKIDCFNRKLTPENMDGINYIVEQSKSPMEFLNFSSEGTTDRKEKILSLLNKAKQKIVINLGDPLEDTDRDAIHKVIESNDTPICIRYKGKSVSVRAMSWFKSSKAQPDLMNEAFFIAENSPEIVWDSKNLEVIKGDWGYKIFADYIENAKEEINIKLDKLIPKAVLRLVVQAIGAKAKVPVNIDCYKLPLKGAMESLESIVKNANVPITFDRVGSWKENGESNHKVLLGYDKLLSLIQKANLAITLKLSDDIDPNGDHFRALNKAADESEVPVHVRLSYRELSYIKNEAFLRKEVEESMEENDSSLSIRIAQSWFLSEKYKNIVSNVIAEKVSVSVTLLCEHLIIDENNLELFSLIAEKVKSTVVVNGLRFDVKAQCSIGKIKQKLKDITDKGDMVFKGEISVENHRQDENYFEICSGEPLEDKYTSSGEDTDSEGEDGDTSGSNNDDDKPDDSAGGGAVLADKKESKPVSVFLSYEPEFLDLRLEEAAQNETKEEREYRESLEELEEGLAYEAQKAEVRVVVDIENATEEALPYIQDVPVTKISGWLQLLPEVSS